MVSKKGDPIFSGISVGEGLIDTEDYQEEDKTGQGADEKQEKPSTEGFVELEDGSIEIQEDQQEKSSLNKSEEEEPEDEETEKEDLEEIDEVIDKGEDKEDPSKKETPSEDDTGSETSPSSSPYLTFARENSKEGVFIDFTDDEWNQLVEETGSEGAALGEIHRRSLESQLEAGIEEYKNSLTDEDRALYEAKAKGVPLDEYGQAKHSFDKYDKLDEESITEDESLQESIVREGLKLKGFSDEEIDEEVSTYKDVDKLETKAKRFAKSNKSFYKGKLSEIEQRAEQQQEEQQRAYQEQVNRVKSLVNNTNEIIPNVKINKQTKEKILNSMTKPVARDKQGNMYTDLMVTRAKNPEAFEVALHYYHNLGFFNVDEEGNFKPDFSKINSIATKKATEKFKGMFSEEAKSTSGKANVPKKGKDEDDEYDAAFGRAANLF